MFSKAVSEAFFEGTKSTVHFLRIHLYYGAIVKMAIRGDNTTRNKSRTSAIIVQAPWLPPVELDTHNTNQIFCSIDFFASPYLAIGGESRGSTRKLFANRPTNRTGASVRHGGRFPYAKTTCSSESKNTILLLREGQCSQGASWAVCGSGVPPYEFLNLYGVFDSRFCPSFP